MHHWCSLHNCHMWLASKYKYKLYWSYDISGSNWWLNVVSYFILQNPSIKWEFFLNSCQSPEWIYGLALGRWTAYYFSNYSCTTQNVGIRPRFYTMPLLYKTPSPALLLDMCMTNSFSIQNSTDRVYAWAQTVAILSKAAQQHSNFEVGGVPRSSRQNNVIGQEMHYALLSRMKWLTGANNTWVCSKNLCYIFNISSIDSLQKLLHRISYGWRLSEILMWIRHSGI